MEEEEDREVIDGAMEGGCETLEMLKEFENDVLLVECSAACVTVIAPGVIKHEEEQVLATGLTDEGDTVDDEDIVAVVDFGKLVAEAGKEKGLLFLTTMAWGGSPLGMDTGELLTIAI